MLEDFRSNSDLCFTITEHLMFRFRYLLTIRQNSAHDVKYSHRKELATSLIRYFEDKKILKRPLLN